ncbi:hypothetical protein KXD40_007849 [Peronospora effusa]|nr:hypothetical protein KXD40_007849 [Peronospora effusa]
MSVVDRTRKQLDAYESLPFASVEAKSRYTQNETRNSVSMWQMIQFCRVKPIKFKLMNHRRWHDRRYCENCLRTRPLSFDTRWTRDPKLIPSYDT